jgi:hypothetical protein
MQMCFVCRIDSNGRFRSRDPLIFRQHFERTGNYLRRRILCDIFCLSHFDKFYILLILPTLYSFQHPCLIFSYLISYVLYLMSHVSFYQPIITVKHPSTIEPPWEVESPNLAADFPPIITVEEPMAIVSGGPQQTHWSPILAAGIPPIMTVGSPAMIGPPT